MILLLSMVSLAIASAASNNVSLELFQNTVVNGTTFKAGAAKLEIKDNKAVLKQGKVVAEASIKVEAAK